MEQVVAAEQEGLVAIVKHAQKLRMRGDKGTWKEFLNSYDKKKGDAISDPARRSAVDLIAFLKTFSKEEDLKFFATMLRSNSKRKAVDQLYKSCTEPESPEQRLVSLTLEHPEYLLDYAFPSHDKEWMVTKLPKLSKATQLNSMISVDCEMVLCEDGTEAVVQVCVVDQNLEVKLNALLNPDKTVANYRTEITGISAKDLEGVTCSLVDVQKKMKKLLRHGTILVGHGLSHDLQALKLDHSLVIDTSYIFKYIDEPARRRPSLKDLCKAVLAYELRKEGAPHNCLDDAQAAMKLVLAKLNGFETGISSSEKVQESELAKLFLHRIPIDVPRDELQSVFSKNFTFELQPSFSARKDKYSALAVFKDSEMANEAFNSLEGKIEKDIKRRPQKRVTFELSTGLPADLYVRKMAQDTSKEQRDAKKRRLLEAESTDEEWKKQKSEVEDDPEEPKKQATKECVQHMIEIESLRREVHERDDEIVNLQKIISALTRKQGL